MNKKPGMFQSPGQAAGYLLAWLFASLIASALIGLIVLLWKWIIEQVLG